MNAWLARCSSLAIVALVPLALGAGCVVDDSLDPVASDGPATTHDGATSGASDTDGMTSGASTITCNEAVTEEQCAVAQPELDFLPCSWLPRYTATIDEAGACTFEPAGGTCLPHAEGDTSCGSFAAECGYEVFGEIAQDGTITIARTESTCEQYPSDLDLALCTMLDGTDEDDAVLCACGCSPAYPST